MTWGQMLAMQGGALFVLLSMVGILVRAIVRGTIVSGTVVADVRKDRDERVDAAERRAQERVEAADRRAQEWRDLYKSEHEAHNTTRSAHGEEIRAALLASSEGAQIGVELLKEIRHRQIEASRDPAA